MIRVHADTPRPMVVKAERSLVSDNYSQLPLFPLSAVLFPGASLPLHIFEERYRRLIADCLYHESPFGVVLIRSGHEVGDEPEIHRVGTAATIVEAARFPDGRYAITVQGGQRFRVLTEDWSTAYLTARIAWLDEPGGDTTACQALGDLVRTAWESYVFGIARLSHGSELGRSMARQAAAKLPNDPTRLAYSVLAQFPQPNPERQHFLELTSTEERLAALADRLVRERRLMTAFQDDVSLPYSVDRPRSSN